MLVPPGGPNEPEAEPGYALPSPPTEAPNPSVVAGDSSGGSSALAVAAGASAGGTFVRATTTAADNAERPCNFCTNPPRSFK